MWCEECHRGPGLRRGTSGVSHCVENAEDVGTKAATAAGGAGCEQSQCPTVAGAGGWSRAQAQGSQVFFQLPGYTPSQEHLQGSPKVCALSSHGRSSETHPLHAFTYFPCHAWTWLQHWLEDPEQLYEAWGVCTQVLVRLEGPGEYL